jgi:YD repeat-containing protein
MKTNMGIVLQHLPGATQNWSTVTFDGIPAAIESWGDTGIEAVVPPGTVDGNVNVSFAYDSRGRRISATDQNNKTTIYSEADPALTPRTT